MFDAQCDLAALVYDEDQNPDTLLRDFASDMNQRGYRAVGLVQLSSHDLAPRQLSALLIHSGAKLPLLQDLGTGATGCRLDVDQLHAAGAAIATAIEQGADLVIINRFGKQEREGKGLLYLIERALDADIPVLIAVPRHRFSEWISFADGMSVKLKCDSGSLGAWWRAVSARGGSRITPDHTTVCEAYK
jgi:hypothetical protein